MAAQRVFVIWTHPLFLESVRMLLDHPSIEWLGATFDYHSARNTVSDLEPDIVLIEENQEEDVNPTLVEFLLECPVNVRVIGLNLNDNRLSLFTHEQGMIGEAQELLQIVLKE